MKTFRVEYKNKSNSRKRLEVIYYEDRHCSIAQYMKGAVVYDEKIGKTHFDEEYKDYIGARHNRRRLRRIKKNDLVELLEDYVRAGNED